jgi:hypothetical protein
MSFLAIIYALIFAQCCLADVNLKDTKQFLADHCSNSNLISHEMIELELSGYRWSAGTSRCLKQDRFKTIVAGKENLIDLRVNGPEFLIKKGRDFKILSETLLRTEEMVVKFSYIGTQNGMDVPVIDSLTYTRNYGTKRELRGCASMLDEPQHLVMREECTIALGGYGTSVK